MPLQTNTAQSVRAAVVLAALGVVFGDIGTSPIYTVQTVFNPRDPHPVPLNTDNVYGIVSLIFWSVMLIVTLTYVTLVMRADNDGEGGIMALITLLRRWGLARGRRTALMLAALGVFGAALFFGDSMITPAISVLSAIEGIEVVDPGFKKWVVPITVVDHRRAVRRSATRDRCRRTVLRSDHGRLVHRHRRVRSHTASPAIRKSSRRCRRPMR